MEMMMKALSQFTNPPVEVQPTSVPQPEIEKPVSSQPEETPDAKDDLKEVIILKELKPDINRN